MSLIHWWPLNGDLKDRGVANNDLNVLYGSPSFTVGKIGKCANLTSGEAYYISNSMACNSVTGYSVAAWVKFNSLDSGHRSGIWSNRSGGPVWSSCEIYNNKLHYYHYNNAWLSTFGNTTLTTGRWYHVCFVIKNRAVTFYIDGVNDGTGDATLSGDNQNLCDSVGCSWTGSYALDGYLNDVRIYDHALSAKEVHEISKGLMLHYTFNDPYVEGTTNLINQSSPITYIAHCSTYGNGVKIDWTIPENQADTYFFFNTSDLTPGQTYTFSYTASGLLPDSDVVFAFANTYAAVKMHNGRNEITFTPTSSEARPFFDDWVRDTRLNNLVLKDFQLEKKDHATPYRKQSTNLFYGRTDFSNASNWSRSQIDSTAPTIDSDGNMVLYGVGADGNHQSYTVSLNGGWISLSPSTSYTLSVIVKHSSTTAAFNMYFYEHNDSGYISTKNIRFTVGSSEVNTWIKHSITLTTSATTTKMYTELNCYNCPNGDTITMLNNSIQLEQSNIVYDSSGYGHNGKTMGDCQVLTDTRSGEHSLFNNGGELYNWYEQNKAFILGDLGSAMTFEKMTICFWAKIIATYDNHSGVISLSMQPEWPTDYQTGGLAQYDGCFRFNIPNGSPTCSQNIIFNEWHHYAFTWDGSILSMYRDGVWVGGSSDGTGAINESRYVYLGLNGAGGMWRKSQIYWGDFKIFATALSASDVLAEYNRKAAIDKSGNLFTGEFVENCENIIEKVNYYIANVTGFRTWAFLAHCTENDYNANWPNDTDIAFSAYVQDNCQVTQTSDGIRIYSSANASSDNTWGGLVISPMMNSRCLIKGHHYRISWHVKGHSSRAMTDIYWTNNVGWGQYPDASPTVHKYAFPPANFDGEMDCFYDFTIEDEVFKTTTDDVHSGFSPNTSYLAYASFKIGFTYQSTGEMGTDIYITNICLMDVTDGKKYNITKNGIINANQIDSGTSDKVKIKSSGAVSACDIIEL